MTTRREFLRRGIVGLVLAYINPLAVKFKPAAIILSRGKEASFSSIQAALDCLWLQQGSSMGHGLVITEDWTGRFLVPVQADSQAWQKAGRCIQAG